MDSFTVLLERDTKKCVQLVWFGVHLKTNVTGQKMFNVAIDQSLLSSMELTVVEVQLVVEIHGETMEEALAQEVQQVVEIQVLGEIIVVELQLVVEIHGEIMEEAPALEVQQAVEIHGEIMEEAPALEVQVLEDQAVEMVDPPTVEEVVEVHGEIPIA